MKMTIAAVVILVTLAAFGRPSASATYDMVLNLEPATENSCIAIELSTATPLAGLRWFHNDSQANFRRIVLVEGQPGQAPSLNSGALILEDVSGANLGWGEVSFSAPVTSSTGTAYALFYFPIGSETTHLGDGGGPGLGIERLESGAAAQRSFLSGDGVDWVAYDPSYEIGVEGVPAPLQRGTGATVRVLSEMDDYVEKSPEALPELPKTTQFFPPTPNPFNPRVELRYELAQAGAVELLIHDIMGRLVHRLVHEQQEAGRHAVIWEGSDVQGRPVASGVYYATFRTQSFEQRQNLVLLR